MRTDCKFFESRTYPTGDTVRKCDLDMAPEAPWRCPEDCPAFQPRLAAVAWDHGSLLNSPTPTEPSSVGDDPSIGALLDAAEDIVNAVVAETKAVVAAEKSRVQKKKGGKRFPWRRGENR